MYKKFDNKPACFLLEFLVGSQMCLKNNARIKIFLRIENSSDCKKVQVAIFQKFYNKIKCMKRECRVGSQTWPQRLDKDGNISQI